MDLAQRVALVLIRLHPPAWRRRYADEVSALVEASPVSVRSVVDLARSGAGEWTRAGWRSVVIEPGQWPHPGRLAALWVLTALSYYAGIFIAQFVEAVYVAAVVLSYGMTDRALDVLSGRIDGVYYNVLPSLTPGIVVYVLVGLFLYFGLPALPVIAVARWSGLGRHFPFSTRLAVMVAFSTTAFWLPSSMPVFGGTVLGGWVLASGFFPRRPAAGPGANSTPMVNA